MGTTALRELLKSLCNNLPWQYAVFWKLRHGSPTILTYEDGYFDYPKLRKPAGSLSDDIFSSVACGMSSVQFETDACNYSSEAHPIGCMVAEMLYQQYALGEGILGKVALMGDHCWVSFNDILTGQVNPEVNPEYPAEWLLQFAFGMKTILVVPMLSQGVLQLGSLEEVAEDTEMVNYLKDRFDGVHTAESNNAPFSLKKDFQAQLSSSPVSSFIENLIAPSSIPIRHVKVEDLDLSEDANSLKLNKDYFSTLSQIPFLTFQDGLRPYGKELPEAFQYGNKENVDFTSIDMGVSNPSESMDTRQLEMVEGKLSELSCLVEELQSYSECNNFLGTFQQSFAGTPSSFSSIDLTQQVFQQSFSGITSSYSAGDMKQPSGGLDANDETVSRFLSFPKDCELHKALGPAVWGHANEKFWNSSFLDENNCSGSSLICNKDSIEKTRHSSSIKASGAGYLLEAVVTNAYNVSDNTSSDKTNFLKPSKGLLVHFATSSPLSQCQFEASASMGNNLVQWNHAKSESIADERNSHPISDTLKGIVSMISGREQQESENSHTQLWKEQKSSYASSKRRAGPGDNQRPRPRDRQLIQDRVKELRKLVPNGGKCSIDGLLDRTVKHILYLRSITFRTEKLRQWVDQQVDARKSWRSADLKDNGESGASWALEFGSELQMCPIVVEDLTYPGHMLIEVLCNEHVLFLEIASVIRGLELTILKGVMETRSNNTWSHFIVEARKGFHRLDIFWPLMQLLRPKRKPISSKDLTQ